MFFKKYQFDDLDKWNEIRVDLPHEDYVTDDGDLMTNYLVPADVVVLGNICVKEPELDEEYNIVKDAEYSDTYHVDILWQNESDEPESFKPYFIQLDNEGVHGFAGIDYLNQ